MNILWQLGYKKRVTKTSVISKTVDIKIGHGPQMVILFLQIERFQAVVALPAAAFGLF